jgi:MbtH protein
MHMHTEQVDEGHTYKVVVNGDEQYSIWFANQEAPAGWREVGQAGSKEECLTYIKEAWTDMRPLGLRERMQAVASEPGPGLS